jgi:outer membrane protein OmpA-like peptidoglycan-associated protein
MTNKTKFSPCFPRQLAFLTLASVLGFPALVLQAQQESNPTDTPPAAQQQTTPAMNTPKEGFWGHVNPFARKKWVRRQTDPINDRLTELDGLSAKNSNDIKDVDQRSQAGIHNAQTTADAASQAAVAANGQALQANGLAQGASGRVDKLNSTVSGLDQYHQVSEIELSFRGGQATLNAAARQKLDQLAASLSGRQGYILEVEGRAPGAGNTGIQSSERLTEAVKRYLVTNHEIPVYRLHSVALGNAPVDTETRPTRTASVHVRLMENTLAAQEVASHQSVASVTGAERP